MRIDSSQVAYQSQYRSTNITTVIDQTLSRPAAASASAIPAQHVDKVQLSPLAGASAASSYDNLDDMDPKLRLAILILESLLGHKIKLYRAQGGACAVAASSAQAAAQAAPAAPEIRQRTEIRSESEQVSFQAQGVAETSDGRSIQFSVSLNLERQLHSVSTTVGPAAVDPLVVNFGGAPARLTEAKVAFDLNADGREESISFLADGSGFLAIDSNGDGKVNDGRELLGPQTGDGFAELAAYDADGNGWIDESDPVFTSLRIWTADGLSTLLDKGIGAIATASVGTPFAIKDSDNQLQGELRATGVYLSENGSAGTVQQVDLAVG